MFFITTLPSTNLKAEDWCSGTSTSTSTVPPCRTVLSPSSPLNICHLNRPTTPRWWTALVMMSPRITSTAAAASADADSLSDVKSDVSRKLFFALFFYFSPTTTTTTTFYVEDCSPLPSALWYKKAKRVEVRRNCKLNIETWVSVLHLLLQSQPPMSFSSVARSARRTIKMNPERNKL